MKEYLEKQEDGSYELVMRGIVGKDGDIEVPNGAECAILGSENNIYFWKSDSFIGGTHVNWVDMGRGYNAEWYLRASGGSKLIWQRHTQPEELPFVDSLNNQYAEIEQVRQHSIEATLAERQAQYGCFEDVARTTGKIMEALSEVRVNGLNDLPYPHRMALYMIASKMARIVNGDFNHKDGWHDIGGYSKLIEDLL